ncbi:hypothetical protein Bbelb_136440 [Branchiostoma belcheri]|nr:hypothetical protein Bbelb_136440 [Branchiostoma belcheri]
MARTIYFDTGGRGDDQGDLSPITADTITTALHGLDGVEFWGLTRFVDVGPTITDSMTLNYAVSRSLVEATQTISAVIMKRSPLSIYEKGCGKVKHTALPADQPLAVVHCTTVCRPRATEMDMGTTLRST